MNKNTTILRGDKVLELKIILLTIYCIFTIVVVLITNGSAYTLYEQLLLQVGSIISDAAPVKVQP